MSFPEIRFGKCPVCGGGGGNDDAHIDASNAFSTEDHSGVGYELVLYEGKWICQLCRKELKANAESAIRIQENRDQQKFWEKMGVKKNMDR